MICPKCGSENIKVISVTETTTSGKTKGFGCVKACYPYNKDGECMSRLWRRVLNIFNCIGDNSGCHQMPERCLVMKGYRFPICERCTGVFIGQLSSIIFFILGIRVLLIIDILK